MEHLQEQPVCMKIGFNWGQMLHKLSKCRLPYGEQKIGRTEPFWVAFQVQKQCDLWWRRWMHRCLL